VLDSYEDHSAFLTTRSRYASLFDLSPTDYKAWAHGLKKAGYATDPAYAYKLISLIEEYELHRFDLMTKKDLAKKSSKKKTSTKQRQSKTTQTKQSKVIDTASKGQKQNLQPVGSVYAYSTHDLLKVNGLKYVIARLGDTYGSIADEFGMKEKNLLVYNEMSNQSKLTPGQRVYLQKKKQKAPKGFDTHVVQAGESLYSISQFYGIRLVDLFKMNDMPHDQKAKAGQIIKIRP